MLSGPLWRTIYHKLRAEIAAGALEAGARLPTEKALAAQFEVNRHTVRRALAELSREGAVQVRRGSGAYVSEHVAYDAASSAPPIALDADALDAPWRAEGVTSMIVRARVAPAPSATSLALSLAPHARIAEIELSGRRGAKMCFWALRSLPAARFPELAARLRASGDVEEALRNYGVTAVRRAWARVRAVSADARLAARLREVEGRAALRVESAHLDMAGEAVEYRVTCWRAASVTLSLAGEAAPPPGLEDEDAALL